MRTKWSVLPLLSRVRLSHSSTSRLSSTFSIKTPKPLLYQTTRPVRAHTHIIPTHTPKATEEMPSFLIPMVSNKENGRLFGKVKELTFSKPDLGKLHKAAKAIDYTNNHSLLGFGYSLLKTVDIAEPLESVTVLAGMEPDDPNLDQLFSIKKCQPWLEYLRKTVKRLQGRKEE